MPVVMLKPDALTGPAAHISHRRAAGLLLALARHCGHPIHLPPTLARLAEGADRQITQRAATEPAFRGRLHHPDGCAHALLTHAHTLTGDQATPRLLERSLHDLRFRTTHHADLVLTPNDVDTIYPAAPTGDHPPAPAAVRGYLAGHPVRILHLAGDQHPAALHHWKTYLRHLLLDRPPDGSHLLRNLAHVCDGPDAAYLTHLTATTHHKDPTMATFTWHPTPVPDSVTIRQVYGFLFVPDGRLLLRVDGPNHSLAGGRPEPGETTPAATLRREAREEIAVDLAQPCYLGYQQVDEHNGTPAYAQVRMAATITTIRPAAPDPDTGRTYRRRLVHPAEAADLLDWGSTGHQQATAAAAAAVSVLGLPGGAFPPDNWI